MTSEYSPAKEERLFGPAAPDLTISDKSNGFKTTDLTFPNKRKLFRAIAKSTLGKVGHKPLKGCNTI
jgi:hypothetical protein